MANGIPTGLKSAAAAAAGRKFGLTVGSAFTVLALIGRWRGHHTSFAVLGTLGVLLLVAALVVPTALGPVERVWMAAAHAISRVTTPIFMGVVYFIILTPVGFIRRAVGGNALAHRSGKDGFWSDRSRQPRSSLDRQF